MGELNVEGVWDPPSMFLLVLTLWGPFALSRRTSRFKSRRPTKVILLPRVPSIVFPQEFLPVLMRRSMVLTGAIAIKVPKFKVTPMISGTQPPNNFRRIYQLRKVVSRTFRTFPTGKPSDPITGIPRKIGRRSALLVTCVRGVLVLPKGTIGVIFHPKWGLKFGAFFTCSSSVMGGSTNVSMGKIPIRVRFSLPT